jgi:hypothetical protein
MPERGGLLRPEVRTPTADPAAGHAPGNDTGASDGGEIAER